MLLFSMHFHLQVSEKYKETILFLGQRATIKKEEAFGGGQLNYLGTTNIGKIK